jgi:MinD-like ATPase involved in chromosome partitioning or flagellar assembly
MKKVVRLTESDLIKIVKKVIKENDSLEDKIKDTFYSGFSSKPSDEDTEPVFNAMKPYLNSGCIAYKYLADYLVFDVGSPLDFEDCGFSRSEANKAKEKLRKHGFNSWGVGQYAKKIK